MEFIKKYKNYGIQIIIALAVGFIGNLLGGSMEEFNTLNKPLLIPPAIVFPIVWTILYVLMGISAAMIMDSKNPNSKKALSIYYLQLIVNAFWSLFFFRFLWLAFSFGWLLILLLLVGIMIYQFYKIQPKAGYLQIPYFFWLVFAGILNLLIAIMN